MRRHLEVWGDQVAVTSRPVRLDPQNLPVRFRAPDARADGGERGVTLEPDRVVLDRRLGSVAMKIAVPIETFLGVAVRLAVGETEIDDRYEVILAHQDRALDVTLFEAADDSDVVAEWQSWAARLGLPLIAEDLDGLRRELFPRIGAISAGRPRPRRRRAFLARRPRFLVRRKCGRPSETPASFAHEHEIIARDLSAD